MTKVSLFFSLVVVGVLSASLYTVSDKMTNEYGEFISIISLFTEKSNPVIPSYGGQQKNGFKNNSNFLNSIPAYKNQKNFRRNSSVIAGNSPTEFLLASHLAITDLHLPADGLSNVQSAFFLPVLGQSGRSSQSYSEFNGSRSAMQSHNISRLSSNIQGPFAAKQDTNPILPPPDNGFDDENEQPIPVGNGGVVLSLLALIYGIFIYKRKRLSRQQ